LTPAKPTRRAALVTACGAAYGIALKAQQSAPVLGPPPHQKGPKVFLDYDQVELDAAYDQTVYEPTIDQLAAKLASDAETVRKNIGEPKRVAYGSKDIEKLDIYRTAKPNAPIMIFLHGGRWRVANAHDYGFPAENFVRNGAHYIAPDFDWVQNVNGDLGVLVSQIRNAVAWVYKNAASFGGDPNRIYLSGHSSGGHLAGVALTMPWKDLGVPENVIKGGVLLSGIYDLKAVRLSNRSSYIHFDDKAENDYSPQRHLDKLTVPTVVMYGTRETPEFQRQSREFAAAIQAAGKPVETIVADNYVHMESVESMANPYGLAGHAALKMMKLAT
jgi:arylformamidase